MQIIRSYIIPNYSGSILICLLELLAGYAGEQLTQSTNGPGRMSEQLMPADDQSGMHKRSVDIFND